MLGIAAIAISYLASKSCSLPYNVPLELSIRAVATDGPSDPPWVPVPSGRGTYELVLSCFTTLGLCVWTVIHLNIDPNSSTTRSVFRRLLWMVGAVFVPEIVVWSAFEQWKNARVLRDEINRLGLRAISGDQAAYITPGVSPCFCIPKLTKDVPTSQGSDPEMKPVTHISSSGSDPPKEIKRFEPWTTTQAFYAVIGGFAVKSASFWKKPYITLTPAGILELAKMGLLPQLSKEEIEDKSKADTIAKALICIQALWFFTQSMARLANGLPLTLLEIHTLTHVGCALGMYLMWFKKPYNVSRPTLCEDPRVVDLVAFFALTMNDDYETDPMSYPMVYGSELKCCQSDDIDFSQLRSVGMETTSPKALALWQAANRAVDRFRKLGSHFRLGIHSCTTYLSNIYVVHRRSNLRVQGKLCRSVISINFGGEKEDTEDFPALLAYSVASWCYGSAHLSAWALHFPTVVEMWFWRASGIALVTLPLLMAVESLSKIILIHVTGDEEDNAQLHMGKRRQFCGILLRGIARTFKFGSLSIVKLYTAARLFIIAEAVVSLRSPPVGTYKTVAWTEFIPHAL